MTTIKIFPTKASALNVHHPMGHRSHIDGAEWPNDVFTMRRLTDGSFTEDPNKAYRQAETITEKFTKPAEPVAAPSAAKPPPAKND